MAPGGVIRYKRASRGTCRGSWNDSRASPWANETGKTQMEMLQQDCPECGRLLELPAGSAGRLAKCPACEATFRVPQTDRAASSSPWSDPLPATGDRTSIQKPAADEFFPDRGEPARSAPKDFNPYQASPSASSSSRVGPYEIVDRSIDQILSPTWAIFAERWPPVILSMLILVGAALLLFVAFFVAALLIAALAGAGGGAETAALTTGLMMLFLIFGGSLGLGYLHVGMARVMLAVARGTPAPLAEMLAPLPIFLRFLGSLLLLMLFTLPIWLFLIVGVGAAQGFGDDAGALAGLMGSLLGSLAGAIFQFFLWPWFPVVCDGRSTALGSIRDSFVIAMSNKLTSFVLVVCSFGLSLVGTLLCYVGQVVTYPLSFLLFVVAYLLITNQRLSVPTR